MLTSNVNLLLTLNVFWLRVLPAVQNENFRCCLISSLIPSCRKKLTIVLSLAGCDLKFMILLLNGSL